MPELRKDPVIGRWVIIATERAKRPEDFKLEKQVVHESADIEANLRPERFVVGFEDNPLSPSKETFFDIKCCAPDGDVLPLGGELVCPLKCA